MGMIVFLFNNRFMNFAAHELIVLKENKFGYEPDADGKQSILIRNSVIWVASRPKFS